MKRVLLVVLLLATAHTAGAQNRPSKIVLADLDEPGERLALYGTVYDVDGETPLEGVHVHVYHTDAYGLYAEEDAPSGTHRIQGDVWTNELGRFALDTVLPGSYPLQQVPAHIHFVIRGDGVPEQHLEMFFEGDPYLSERLIRAENAKGRFNAIRELEKTEAGNEYVSSISLRVRR